MNVLVTGASGGIGRACVERFRAEGAHVIGIDVETSSPADEHFTIDLSTGDCGQEVADVIGSRPLSTVVNNAAHMDYRPAVDTPTSVWDETLAVNLRAPFLVSKALLPNLKAAKGSVVNVSSVHAVATSPAVAAYAASKGGLAALTRALALEWAPEVRVNSVLPGAVDTDMLFNGLFRSGASVEELGRRHPMQRVGTADEIAGAILFLASSEFTTGASLVIDGGATARLSTE